MKTFTVTGNGCRVNLQLTAVDGKAVNMGLPHAIVPTSLPFGAHTPGVVRNRTIGVKNATPLEVPYHWELVDPTARRDARSSGKDTTVFIVSPSSGVLPINGTMTFDVSYGPRCVEWTSLRAKLVVEDVPLGAVDPDLVRALTKRKALTAVADIACLGIDVSGSGKQCDVSIHPQSLRFDGSVFPGRTYTQFVRLTNHSDAPAIFEWAQPVVLLGDGQGSPVVEIKGGAPACRVELAATRGEIVPGGFVDLEVRFTADHVGMHQLNLPCVVKNGPPGGVILHVTGHAQGPELRFVEAEVDFGLVGVGEEAVRTFTISNRSGVPASWRVCEESERSPFAAAQGSVGGIADDSEGVEVVPTEECQMRFRPGHGTIAANSECTVELICTAGRRPQRLRTCVRCDVDGGKSTYIHVRGEVQAPKVFLDVSSVDLGHTYIGVPVQRTFRLTNLSNLPAYFNWDEPARHGKNAETVARNWQTAFTPASGTLASKATLDVTFTFTARRPGRVDALFSCDIEGMSYPLGFGLVSMAKGLVVTYDLVSDDHVVRAAVLHVYHVVGSS